MFARLFILSCLTLLLAGQAHALPRYSLTALPTGTSPNGLNNAGQVVGDIYTDDGTRAFVWSAGQLDMLGTFGGAYSTATAINASGQVTGYATRDNGDSLAFLYSGGTLSPLGVFGGAPSFGIAINDAGRIAGQYISGAPSYRGFGYANGAGFDLGDLGGDFAYAAGINNHGQIVGVSALDNSTPYLAHAFLYADGVMQDLGTLGGSLSAAYDINDAGQVVGYAWVQGSEHAFLYDGGIMGDLGTLGGRRSYANAINAAGVVVGESDLPGDFERAAFIYMDGVMADLNTLVDPAEGWSLYSARGINDSGQIAAWGCRADECSALLLDRVAEVPEPGAGWLMLVGLGLLGLQFRQRSMSMCRMPSSS